MESQEDTYQPGVDQNQGIVGELARNEQTGTLDPAMTGVAQEPQFDPNATTNDEAAREELGADAADNDMMDEEAVEDGDVTIEGTDEEQASFDGPDF